VEPDLHQSFRKIPPMGTVLNHFRLLHNHTLIFLRSLLILHSYLTLGLTSDPFLWGFEAKILHSFLISPCVLHHRHQPQGLGTFHPFPTQLNLLPPSFARSPNFSVSYRLFNRSSFTWTAVSHSQHMISPVYSTEFSYFTDAAQFQFSSDFFTLIPL
jgi:hypothetical protein